MSDPKPIYSPDDEAALLGCAMDSAEVCEGLRGFPLEAFHLHRNRWTWEAILGLRARGLEADAESVAAEFEKAHGEKADLDWLRGLHNAYVVPSHAPRHAQELMAHARRRDLAGMAREMYAAAMRPDLKLDSYVAETMTRLTRLAAADGGAGHIRETVSKLYDQIQDAMQSPRDVFGFGTGLRDMDLLTGGLQPGEMFVLTGKSGMGKSLLAGQLAFTISHNMTLAGVPVAMYSMEMGSVQVARRQLAALTGIPTRLIRTGRVDEAQTLAVVKGMEQLAQQYSLYLSDGTQWTTASLRADLARLKNQYGVRVFVLDYLEQLKDDFGGVEDWTKSARLSSRVRDIARDLDMHALVIQRTNKQGMAEKQTGVEHLSGGASVIFDADLIAVIDKFVPFTFEDKMLSSEQTENMVTVRFVKVREDAPRRYVHLVRKPGLPAFGSYMPEARGVR